MSHAWGEVYKQDGDVLHLVGHFEYNGTADVCCQRVYATREEMLDNWRGDNWRECTCGEAPEDVLLYSDYGGGFHWQDTVCFRCMAIVGNLVCADGCSKDDCGECFYCTRKEGRPGDEARKILTANGTDLTKTKSAPDSPSLLSQLDALLGDVHAQLGVVLAEGRSPFLLIDPAIIEIPESAKFTPFPSASLAEGAKR